MNARPTGNALRIAIKAATRRAVQMAGGPNAVSEHTRVAAGRISDYCNPAHSSFVPLDVAADIDALAGSPVILMAWNDCYTAFKKSDEQKFQEHVADVVTDVGDLMRVAGAGMADGKITPREALDTMRVAVAAKDEITELEKHCARVMTGETA